MAVYQIQPSNVVGLQQHSSLSNNTTVTTYVHRMIIHRRVCLNTWRAMNVLLCFSSAFWIIHNKNCVFVSFRCWKITFQRVYTSIWDTLYTYVYIHRVRHLRQATYITQPLLVTDKNLSNESCLILKICISDRPIDDNCWEKNLCHSRDSNHRSPVFRTGALTT